MKIFSKNNEIHKNGSDRESADTIREHGECPISGTSEDLQKADMPQCEKSKTIDSQEPVVEKVSEQSQATEQGPTKMEESKQNDHVLKVKAEGTERLIQDDKARRPPKESPKQPLPVMLMTKGIYEKIKRTIGAFPAETGGLLLGSIKDYRVTDFIFDIVSYKKRRCAAVWFPHTESLNERIEVAESRGLVFLGVVHSHPRGCIRPSGPDEAAAWSNMTSAGNPHLNAYLLPIVQSAADGPFEFHSYVATCHPEGQGRVILREVKLKLIN